MLSYLFEPVTGFFDSIAWFVNQFGELLHTWELKGLNGYAMVLFIGIVSLFKKRKTRVISTE